MEEIIQKLCDEWDNSFFSDAAITAFITENAYTGLDLEKIVTKVATAAKNDPKLKHLAYLIGIGLLRGNKLTNIRGSMSDKSKAKLSDALKVYKGIQEGVKASANKSDALTLSRLRIVMPRIAAGFLSRSEFPRPVSEAFFQSKSPLVIEWIPVLRDVCMASLIPTIATNSFTATAINNSLRWICQYGFVEGFILKEKDSHGNFVRNQRTLEERKMDVIAYVRASWNSAHISLKQRNSFVVEYLKEHLDTLKAEPASTGDLIWEYSFYEE